jgi:hypothetical protein
MQTAIHIVILPLELLHLLWMAATGELGSTVCFWTWIGVAWVVTVTLGKLAENRRRKNAYRERVNAEIEAARQNTPHFRVQEIRRRMDATVAAARQRKGLTPDS